MMIKLIKYSSFLCFIVNQAAFSMQLTEFKHNLFDLHDRIKLTFSSDDINSYDESLSKEGKERLKTMRIQSGLDELHPLTLLNLSFSSQANAPFIDTINQNYLKNENWIPDWEKIPLKTDMLDHIYSSAKKITNLTKPNDVVIYLGRSPSLLYVINNHLPSPAKHIHINFSGTPGMHGMRQSPENVLRNVVTPERLIFFEEYAHEAGLKQIIDPSQTIYIVDIIGTGASLNSFLQVLGHYFLSVRGWNSALEVKIILMNTKDSVQDEYYLLDKKRKTITFHGSTYILPMTLSTEMLDISDALLDSLDDNVIQFYSSFGREYPAFCWQENYNEHRNSKAQYTEYLEKFLKSYIDLDLEKCDQCRNLLQKRLQCSRCKKAYYCNRECQLKHWKQHKTFCQ